MPYKKKPTGPTLPSVSTQGRAAVYVRMSTEHQKYSITNQLSAITQYAVLHDIDIATVYEDDGKSGLTLKGRPALGRLFGDMAKEGRDFDRILVYDISRWGRFQDPDESAHYEFQCRQHGVEVVYCEEPFVNDGGPLSAIWKNMKRAMAAEAAESAGSIQRRSLSRSAKWLDVATSLGVGRSTASSVRPSPKTEPCEGSFSAAIGRASGPIT
jgi:DNA invertase Pin-like site-specific DNA recombinase